MTDIIPTTTKEYPLIIRVPESDHDLWATIVRNEDKLKALHEGGFFGMEYGKATVSLHNNVVMTISLDQRTYQRNEKVIPSILIVKT